MLSSFRCPPRPTFAIRISLGQRFCRDTEHFPKPFVYRLLLPQETYVNMYHFPSSFLQKKMTSEAEESSTTQKEEEEKAARPPKKRSGNHPEEEEDRRRKPAKNPSKEFCNDNSSTSLHGLSEEGLQKDNGCG